MDYNIKDVSGRLKSTREYLDISVGEMANKTNVTTDEYISLENGEKDQGLPIERRERFAYQHLAYLFKNKKIEPLLVTAPYDEEEQKKPIHLSVHDGQEMDYIISGTLKFQIGSHIETVSEGDCIYYDSMNPHGMIAVDGKDCKFLAILI